MRTQSFKSHTINIEIWLEITPTESNSRRSYSKMVCFKLSAIAKTRPDGSNATQGCPAMFKTPYILRWSEWWLGCRQLPLVQFKHEPDTRASVSPIIGRCRRWIQIIPYHLAVTFLKRQPCVLPGISDLIVARRQSPTHLRLCPLKYRMYVLSCRERYLMVSNQSHPNIYVYIWHQANVDLFYLIAKTRLPSSFVEAWMTADDLWVKRAREQPYFLENACFKCLLQCWIC
jgi:hypothetical protein